MKFWSDYTDINEIEVNLDEYEIFKFEFRYDYGVFLFGYKNNEWFDINAELGQNQLYSAQEVYPLIKDNLTDITSYYGGDSFLKLINKIFPRENIKKGDKNG